MTVYIEKPAFSIREELTSLRNQNRYQEQQFWFENAVTNGTFDTDTSGWTDASPGSASISWNASGYIQLNGVSVDRGTARSTISTTVGKTYKITATDEGSNLSWQINLATFAGGNNILSGSSNTLDKDITFVAQSTTTHIALISLNSTGQSLIDNVSVFEVDANDDVVYRLPKGWKSKDVFEDGLLQREGANYDYIVVYDGFDYYVKPTVAPSATTRTCIIGVRT